MAGEFRIEGLDAVLRKLESVKNEVKRKAARAAATKAMRIVRDAARNNSKGLDDPETASTIWKEIQTRYNAKASKREGGVVVQVGVRGGARPAKGTEDTGHWRMLEFGTSQMPAQPFMRQALENNVQAVTDKFVSELSPAIDKAVTKAR